MTLCTVGLIGGAALANVDSKPILASITKRVEVPDLSISQQVQLPLRGTLTENERDNTGTSPESKQLSVSDRIKLSVPIQIGSVTSGFGLRKHPLLGFTEMHTGVDWAAPRGTPVYAAGDGIVDNAGWAGGYGRQVRIRHDPGYETAYSHLSKYARGIEPGEFVRQGQIIGYVGSTGLSTGPHLHYEVLFNGRLVDPIRITVPHSLVLEGQARANFNRASSRSVIQARFRLAVSPRHRSPALVWDSTAGTYLLGQARRS